jgi:hypothetical protein
MIMNTGQCSTISTSASKFSLERYVFVPSLITALEARMLHEYAQELVNRGQYLPDNQVPNTPARYSAPRMELLLQELLPQVEHASGLSLYPTYSYLRVYKHGDALARHRDRPACEVSVSLCLGYVADSPWPLWIEGPSGVSRIGMKPGDAVLYRGMECAHWREPFPGEHAAQVFLHYVAQNGPNSEWKFDKRRALGRRCVSSKIGKENYSL